MSIFDRAAREPDGLALDDLTHRRSWAELIDRGTRIAHLLRDDLGLGADDHAAVLMESRVEFMELTLGAMLAGIWLTPINWHLGPGEVAYIVEDSGARVLFSDARFESAARQTAAAEVITVGDELDRALAYDPGLPDAATASSRLHTDDFPVLEYRWSHGVEWVSILDSPLVDSD